MFYRGKDLRKEFSKLGDLRGFFHGTFMALTATASTATQKEVIRLLGMRNTVMVNRSPNQPNIIYSVTEKTQTIEETFEKLIEELRTARLETPKTIIFCRTYQDCCDLYLLFKSSLGKEFTNPIGAPDYHPFRLVEMFTACNTPGLKQKFVSSFTNPNGQLKIVVATIAFRMGIDCPNVHRIIHWGPPSDLVCYIQETVRAGRDGNRAVVELLFSKQDIVISFIENSTKSYCKNASECRRIVLFKDFGCEFPPERPSTKCNCCDLCAIVCTCSKCKFPSPTQKSLISYQ